MADIWLTTFSNSFVERKFFVFWFEFIQVWTGLNDNASSLVHVMDWRRFTRHMGTQIYVVIWRCYESIFCQLSANLYFIVSINISPVISRPTWLQSFERLSHIINNHYLFSWQMKSTRWLLLTVCFMIQCVSLRIFKTIEQTPSGHATQ